jgi:D-alanyl-lipoteichoic acid acyltransferase DltB (MBOAT superfamily)
MTFNSWVFIIFFVVVYSIFLLVRKHVYIRNVVFLIASYVFYGYWDWRFLSLLAASTLVDYCVANSMVRYHINLTGRNIRRNLLVVSLVCNLSLLGFFKYYNFFADSFCLFFQSIGLHVDGVTLNILLPVGLSFYTFQSMAYTIDVYRGHIKPCRNLIDFAVYISFFPQLVAGPIERAANLLPQIQRVNPITAAQVDAGLYLILSGFFKKLVVADNMAPLVDQIFKDPGAYGGVGVWIGVLAFTFQIYGDFSGYSDIARGISKLMGFELMVNFKLPYFAVNPQEFWRRWHISLSLWLRDYLYIPLGGNRVGRWATQRNLMLTMSLGGLWHGAAWNFIIWGVYHGVLLVAHRAFEAWRIGWVKEDRLSLVLLPLRWALCFFAVLYGWLLFRSSSISQVWEMTALLLNPVCRVDQGQMINMFWCLSPLIVLELFQHYSRDLLVVLRIPLFLRVFVYALLICWIMLYGARTSSEFIYFQF